MIKIIFKVLVLCAFAFVLTKSWLFYTCSFRIDKIHPPKKLESSNFKREDFSSIDLILDQKYYFLSKGRHTFVFTSEDDKYVIKFFRFHRYKMPVFFRIFKSLPVISHFYNKLENELNDSYVETMQSYKLAYENLQNETAIIYVHLPKSEVFNKKILIFDKFKISHKINLDDYGFVIQKKARPLIKELLRLKKDKTAIENLVISFFDNLNSIYAKKIINNDRHVLNNLGVINNNVIEMDIGRFALKQEIDKKDILEKEAINYTVYLKKWLSKNIPQALPIVDSQLLKINKNE